jgi:dGTPase
MNEETGTPIPAGYTENDVERRYLEYDPDDGRARFERDHDRLIHAPALRRLQGKTQVVTPGEADFFRTRLTHSLEVAQVARRLAQKVGASPDLCEASALLHDLGHPPFAHIGEVTLNQALDKVAKKWSLDPLHEVGGFNGNAQSFRLAVKSLSQSTSFRGLDLTRGVLDGATKYPWKRSTDGVELSASRWCFYPTETDDAEWVRCDVSPERADALSLEAQIVEWADDVAYSIHDVEDWYRAGFIPLEMIASSDDTLEKVAQRVARKIATKDYDQDTTRGIVKAFFRGSAFNGIRRGFDSSDDAKEGLRVMRHHLFDEFTDVRLAHGGIASRHNNDLVVAPVTKIHSKILQQLLAIYVLGHPRMATYEIGQAVVIRKLLQTFVKDLAFNKGKARLGKKARLSVFPADMRAALEKAADNPPELLRLVADHIAGMTDGYAIRLHERVTGVGIGSFNEFV